MKLKCELKFKLLKKMVQLVSAFLIIFLLGINSVKAEFKYSDFDFDEFAEQTYNYWSNYCPDDDSKCVDEIIKSQEKFYTKLYKLLAKYQDRYKLYIDDTIIIATVFFEYSPSAFNDNSGSYNLDEDENIEDLNADFFEQEKDTLKLLINAMVGFENICYGVSNPTKERISGENSGEKLVCQEGNLNTDKNGNQKCYSKLSSETMTLLEKITKGTSIFGLPSKASVDCNSLAKEKGFDSGEVSISNERKVLENAYWDFLTNGRYFDNKSIMFYRYKPLLKKAGVKKISDLYGNKEYEEELKEIRAGIVKDIKNIIEEYRKSNPKMNYNAAGSSAFWWPIGSDETTESNGKIFAAGEPVSTNISSSFGDRTHPIDKVVKFHGGVDLTGNTSEAGIVNIIASKSGTVTAVNKTCKSFGDVSCGGGYGNYIQILHVDGMITIYAHLHENTITVSEGENVEQGQVIAKMGSSGKSTGTHLHFEVRTGSNEKVDPLDYISASNPRPRASLFAAGDLVKFLNILEGSPMLGDQYKVYCNPNDVPTVGPGITLTWNYEFFAKHGYPLTTTNGYYNYCNTGMPVDVVDAVYADVLESHANSVKGTLASAGLELEQYQIDALTTLHYNCGIGIGNFVSMYEAYGKTTSLCTNWWRGFCPASGYDLSRRRNNECNLFLTGDYTVRDTFDW